MTFVKGITASQLLERMGADPASVAVRDQEDFHDEFGDLLYEADAYVVSAGQWGDWAWVWEHSSWRCFDDPQLIRDISTGSVGVFLAWGEGPAEFMYAEDGQLLSAFSRYATTGLRDLVGGSPSRFDSELRKHGADPDTGDYGPLVSRELYLRLAEEVGVGLAENDLFTEPVLSAYLTSP
ncbi:DUF6461 domain-containing protein [Streptomyces sp. PTY087I2]|uniref:DUF6461 domain-containing protein n=1 Tax=Streptomyces sp. PTY087I2 TaxID=1819298 RepID=UPI00114D2558|nr:DUF6461 domain-containing protein [Streptomyces sp. PTY087I2]